MAQVSFRSSTKSNLPQMYDVKINIYSVDVYKYKENIDV